MSTTENKQRRNRRGFTPEFKAEAIRLVQEEGKTVGQVALDLDLTEAAPAQLGGASQGRQRRGQTGCADDERAQGTVAAVMVDAWPPSSSG
jgi:transposase